MSSFKFFLLVLGAVGCFLTACNDDEMLPDPDPVINCDSAAVFIQLTVDTSGNETLYTLSTQVFEIDNPVYLWSTGATTESIVVTETGTYDVTVTGDNDCTAEASIEVDIVAVDPCAGFGVQVGPLIDSLTNETTLSAFAAGGTGPLTYLWSTGETTPDISPGADGTYSVTLTDANGCTATGSVDYVAPGTCDDFSAQLTQNGNALTATASGGTAPYAYLWSDGTTDVSTIQPNNFGTFGVTVTDANDCTASATIDYQDPCTNYSVTIFEGQDSTGMGGNNVLLLASVGNGTAPYVYTWSTGETTADILVPPTGSYGLTVTDANNCEDADQFDF